MLHLEQGRAVRILAEHWKKGCTFKRGCTWRERKLTHIYSYTSGMPAQLKVIYHPLYGMNNIVDGWMAIM